MLRMSVLLAAASIGLAAAPALAADYTLKDLRIQHPYARPTPPGARTGGAYFTLRNMGKDADRLVRVASPAAAAVELHSMTMEGHMMRMRPAAGIDVPAGATVPLRSGGYHVMLVDLARPLAVGDRIPLTLTFERSGVVDVMADVEAVGSHPGHGH